MKKLNFIREKTFKEEIHRAGWNWVTKSLINKFHDPKADVLVDEFIERTFDWDYCFNDCEFPSEDSIPCIDAGGSWTPPEEIPNSEIFDDNTQCIKKDACIPYMVMELGLE